MAEIAFALLSHKENNGAYPKSLDALKCPHIDPFSGAPYIYHPEGDGFVLYSVGYDAKDDGGAAGDLRKLEEKGDIVWRLF